MLKLKTIIYEEQINLLDEEFIYRVFNDIEQFLKENSGRWYEINELYYIILHFN